MNFQSSETPITHKSDYGGMTDQEIKPSYPINTSLKTETGVPFPFNDPSKIHPVQNVVPSSFVQNDHASSFKGNLPPTNEGTDILKSFYLTVSVYPVFNKNINYYHEFWRMYLQNEVLISQMKEYVVKTKEIQARISQFEVNNNFKHKIIIITLIGN